MKRFSTGLFTGLVIGLLIGASSFAIANSPIKLIVNGNEITCDSPPQIINGRVMVPAKNIAESLGATVVWNENNNAIVINKSIISTVPNIKPTIINTEKQEFLALKTKADTIITDSYDTVMENGYSQSIYDRSLSVKMEIMRWGNITSDYSMAKLYYENVLADIGVLNVDNEFLSQFPGNDKYTSERSKDRGELFRDKAELDAELSRLQKQGKL